ncbi:MAG: winged helix-turn-helix transcriptional regulator [Clostridiales bacterium]|nr:winged helix-turn-helix transcriptional regulator [Clostridiales bacterium]
MLDKLKAISDEKRFMIIELLLHKKYCVKALAMHLGISESAVSQHMKVLRHAGLVTGKKESYFMHYEVNRDTLKEIGDYMITLSDFKDESLCNRKATHICCMEKE